MQRFSTQLLVVAVALVAKDGRVLMQRRRRDAEHGGLWEFPGGKVEPEESLESAAMREIEEELDLRIARDALVPVSFASGPLPVGAACSGIVILLYICRDWQGEPVCRDGEEIAWMAPESLARLDMPPLDYPLASALLHAIGENCC